MSFHFNPSLWFICKLCRKSFPDTDKLKSHKIESHLAESLNIKCIVFEEKLLDHEWFPPSQEFSSKQDQHLNLNDALPQESYDDSTIVESQMALKNHVNIILQSPYLSLKTVPAPAQKINSSSAVKLQRRDSTSKSSFPQSRSLGLAENGTLLAKRKRPSDAETCPLPSKQLVTEECDSDDFHETKIRELLSNAVVIKTEPNPDQDDPLFLERQDLAIPIVSEQEPEPEYSTMQLQQTYSYPAVLNIDGKLVQVVGEVGSDDLNLFDASVSPGSGPDPAATTSMTNTFTGKVEFIEYDDDDTVANQNVEIGSPETETDTGQRRHRLNEIRDLSLVSGGDVNSGSGSVPGEGDHKQNSIRCQICNAFFKGRYYLAQHMRRHSKDRAFQCPHPHCESAYKSKSNLRVHLIARHGRETAFKCRFCGKSFAGQATLTTHEATHKGFKYYKCDSLGCEAEEFWSESALAIHMRTQHARELGMEEFACLTCGKRFCGKSSLSKHQKSKHKNVVMAEILP